METLLRKEVEMVKTLTFAKNTEFTVLKKGEPVPPGCALSTLSDEGNIYLLVRGMVDIDAEVGKLESKKSKAKSNLDSLMKKMQIPDYDTKIPADVRGANQNKVLL
jgi:valyl-tRNA synthetase